MDAVREMKNKSEKIFACPKDAEVRLASGVLRFPMWARTEREKKWKKKKEESPWRLPNSHTWASIFFRMTGQSRGT